MGSRPKARWLAKFVLFRRNLTFGFDFVHPTIAHHGVRYCPFYLSRCVHEIHVIDVLVVLAEHILQPTIEFGVARFGRR